MGGMSDMSLKAPGLYLRGLESEEAAPGLTAVTAMVGVAERGPLNSPQAVRNWGEYLEVFGGLWDYGHMAGSINAFFLNGGEMAYGVRVARPPVTVAAPGACASQEEVATAANVSPIMDANGDETLRLKAKNPGAWGISLAARFKAESPRDMEIGSLAAEAVAAAIQVTVDFVQDFRLGANIRLTHRDNPFAQGNHQVTAINTATRQLTLAPPLTRAFPPGSPISGPGFSLEVSDGRRTENFDNLSMNPAHIGYYLDRINGREGLPYLEAARLGHSMLVSAEAVAPGGIPRFKPASTPGPGPAGFAGGGDGTTYARGQLLDAALAPVIQVTSKLKGRAGNALVLKPVPFSGRTALAIPPVLGGAKNLVLVEDNRGWSAGDTLRITHATNGAITETAVILTVQSDLNRLTLTAPLVSDYPLGSTVEVAGRFNLFLTRPGSSSLTADPSGNGPERFFNLSLAAGPRFFRDVLSGVSDANIFSRWVCVEPVPGGLNPPTGTLQLTGGTDPGEMPLTYYTGYLEDGSLFFPPGGTEAVGMAALEAVGEVNLLALPDLAGWDGLPQADLVLAQRQMLFQSSKLGERFALLDPPRNLDSEGALLWPTQFADDKLARFGAFYYPWLVLALEGENRPIPPSGAVAGLIAQADRRDGVGKAPANMTLKGVVGLGRELEAAEQGDLNLRGVNCIRKFENGAIRLWGARSLSREDAYIYVNNRRLVLAVIKALSRNLLWAVFEPNDYRLRARIKDSLEGYFQTLLARGQTAGNKPGEAYYVKVDEELNGPEISEAGQIIAEVGLALNKPAEFIVLTVKRSPEILTLVEEEA